MSKQKHINKLIKDGYCLIPPIIDKKKCIFLKEELNKSHKKYKNFYAGNEKSKHRLNHQNDEKIVYNLQNKNLEFIRIASSKKIIDIVEPYLKRGSYEQSDEIIIRQMTARNPSKDKGAQQLHIDSRIPGLPFSIMVVATIMLDEFTSLNGATRLIPGSHLKKSYPKNNKTYKNEKIISGEPGSLLLMDGSLWHGGGENIDGTSRWGVLFTYVRWFIKQAFDFTENIPENVYSNLNNKEKTLLGLNSHPPLDEFKRISSRSKDFYYNKTYKLPI